MRKKRLQKTPNNVCKKLIVCKRIFVFSLIAFITSLMAQMYISNATALKGKDFRHLHEEKARLEKEMALLQFEDSRLSCLEYVEQKAFELGFEEMAEPIYAISSPSLASLSSQ